ARNCAPKPSTTAARSAEIVLADEPTGSLDGATGASIMELNGHSSKSRVAVMRGRFVLGLSNANRRAAGVEVGDDVEVELELDPQPRVVVEPAGFARALS